MEWRCSPGQDPVDPNGVADLLSRACTFSGAVSPTDAVSGTRFVTSTAEMLRVSRTIEAATLAAPGSTLYVGFQRADRAEPQRVLYDLIQRSGTDILAFAVDATDDVEDWGTWVRVADDPQALVSQWFLVRSHRGVTHAMVGFQVPGTGVRRAWEGFTSTDERLVTALIEHLEQVATSSAVG